MYYENKRIQIENSAFFPHIIRILFIQMLLNICLIL